MSPSRRLKAMVPDADSLLPQWLVNAIVGIIAGALSGMGGIAWFGGGVKATLDAHDQRITQLENDIRYEIRALRESVDALHREVTAFASRRDLK